MTTRPAALLLLGVVVCCLGAAGRPPAAAQPLPPAAAAGAPAERKSADKPAEKKDKKEENAAEKKSASGSGGGGAKQGKDDAKPAEKAACMHCGSTCGLAPICVCERGTKKRTKTEFETVCEPLCVPGCGSKPLCFGDRAATGCTDCCEEECRCPGRVRSCKRLKKKTVDEEVPKITRRVAYVCDCCAGRCGPGCCAGGHADRVTAWWRRMTWWWPR